MKSLGVQWSVCEVLGYAFYDKGQVFAHLTSNVQERGTTFHEAFWILETAPTAFGTITKTNLLGNFEGSCFEWNSNALEQIKAIRKTNMSLDPYDLAHLMVLEVCRWIRMLCRVLKKKKKTNRRVTA